MSRAVLAVALCCLVGSAQALPSIRVQQVCGFGFVSCGLSLTTLERDGPALDYFVDDTGALTFSLAYAGDSFVMQALHDNGVATSPSLPFGLIGWAESGPMVPPIGGGPPGTQLFFRSWMTFPMLVGTPLVVPLPPVPEPATAALLLAGLLLGVGRKALAPSGHARGRTIARPPTTTTHARWTSPTRARNSAARTGPR